MQLSGRIRAKDAFTLMELMVVIFLLGIIAAFALPNYDKSIRKAHEQDMVEQLRSLHAANLMYNAQNGTYWDTNGTGVNDLGTINDILGLRIISSDGTMYSYSSPAGGGTYAAAATWGVYTIQVTQAILSTAAGSPNPCCATSNCLSVNDC